MKGTLLTIRRIATAPPLQKGSCTNCLPIGRGVAFRTIVARSEELALAQQRA